jgi:hypothetical protein
MSDGAFSADRFADDEEQVCRVLRPVEAMPEEGEIPPAEIALRDGLRGRWPESGEQARDVREDLVHPPVGERRRDPPGDFPIPRARVGAHEHDRVAAGRVFVLAVEPLQRVAQIAFPARAH